MKLFALLVAVFSTISVAADSKPDAKVEALYDVSTAGTSLTVKAGQKGTIVIHVATKNGAHVSEEAPLKIELSSKESKFDKEKLSLKDSTAKTKGDAHFEVGFVPNLQGPTSVEAKLTFFICTESLCARQVKTLSVPVEVM
jgi:hypothetical protein